MKKILLLNLCLIMSFFPLITQAQEQGESTIGKGWFIQANLAESVFYGNQELGQDFSKNPFRSFRNRLALSVSLGKWFSPEIALRTKVNGIWGRSVISEDAETNANRFFTLNQQVLLDMTNLVGGYKENRKWHLITFFGGGLGRSITYNRWATNLSAGILNQFVLNNRWALNVEMGYTLHTRDFDGPNEIKLPHHSLKNEDQQILFELGVTYQFGK